MGQLFPYSQKKLAQHRAKASAGLFRQKSWKKMPSKFHLLLYVSIEKFNLLQRNRLTSPAQFGIGMRSATEKIKPYSNRHHYQHK
jgi:hypothetical protein